MERAHLGPRIVATKLYCSTGQANYA